jgi:curved DNA-binding protein CbpA
MGAKSSRQYTYQQYYNAMKESGHVNSMDLKNIDLNKIDPYEVLNLSKKFSLNELKESYRALAIKTHPDKPGGNKDIFNIVTDSFEKLTIEYKKREKDLSHKELKHNSELYFNKYSRETNDRPKDVQENNTGESFTTKFNNNFEKCKMEDDCIDFGYGEKMEESTKIREDITIDKITKKKINNESFNELFNKNVPVYKQLVKYIEPEAMVLSKSLNYTELGGKKPDDYSSSYDKNNSLAYTDYMRAHDGTRLVDPSSIKNVKMFNNVDDYESYSNDIAKKIMSPKELKMQEKNKLKIEKEELKRIERLEKYDSRAEKTFEKSNKLFLR